MKKRLAGTVVAISNESTIIVGVNVVSTHRIYKKQIHRLRKFHVHGDGGSVNVGDTVEIEESRPLSKTKRWVLVKGEK